MGARKGGSSSIRRLGLRPEQLEWGTVSPEAPARAPSPPGAGPGAPWQATHLCPSLCLGSLSVILHSPPPEPRSHSGVSQDEKCSWEGLTWSLRSLPSISLHQGSPSLGPYSSSSVGPWSDCPPDIWPLASEPPRGMGHPVCTRYKMSGLLPRSPGSASGQAG